jgi:hypothetical protein
MNNLKVFVLLAGLTSLFVAIGGSFGGQSGMVLAFVFAGLMNFVMYFASSKMVLRMYGARVVTEQEAPELYAMVDRLRQRAGLPMPTLAIAPHAQPNAFATGRNPQHAVVAVTEGFCNWSLAMSSRACSRTSLHTSRTTTCCCRRSARRLPAPSAISRISGCSSAGATTRTRILSRESPWRSSRRSRDADPVRDQSSARVQG